MRTTRSVCTIALYCAAMLLWTVDGRSQISWPEIPPFGKTIPMDADTSISVASLDLSRTGEQTWSFTETVDLWQLAYRTLEAAGTPYESAFPTAQWVEAVWQFVPAFLTYPDTIVELYNYRRVNGGLIEELGMGMEHPLFKGAPFNYPEPSQIFPTLLSTDTPSWLEYRRFNPMFLGLIAGVIVDSSIVEVDAWGELTIPTGTYSCIRLKRHEFRTISAGIILNEKLETYTYVWLTQSFDPVLSVTSEAVNGEYFSTADIVMRAASPLGVEQEEILSGSGSVTPSGWALQQNYPNPFNPRTSIEFCLPEAAHVEITVTDRLGRRIRTLVSERKPAGTHRIIWDGTDERGLRLASGVYLYTLNSSGITRTRKLLMLK